MIYRHASILLTSLILSTSSLFAKAALIGLSKKVKDSDLIARVSILSTKEYDKSSRYRNIAKAEITQLIKGEKAGQKINLQFNNGYMCPNVGYTKGDDCIIFATKLTNGDYHTYNTYFGKLNITTEINEAKEKVSTVSTRALFGDYPTNVTVDRAVEIIKKQIQENKKVEESKTSEAN